LTPIDKVLATACNSMPMCDAERQTFHCPSKWQLTKTCLSHA